MLVGGGGNSLPAEVTDCISTEPGRAEKIRLRSVYQTSEWSSIVSTLSEKALEPKRILKKAQDKHKPPTAEPRERRAADISP